MTRGLFIPLLVSGLVLAGVPNVHAEPRLERAAAPGLERAVAPGPRVPAAALPAAPPGDDTAARLDFLCEHLDRRARSLRLYWGLWLAVHTSMAAAQGIVAGTSDRIFHAPARARAYRNSLAIGAITSGVGLVATLASYPPGAGGCDSARRLRDGTRAGEARALAAAEGRLRDTASGLRFGRSWLTHLGGVLVNLAAGMVLWLAFDQPIDGAVQLLAGTAVAQAQVWTQPMAPARDYDDYLRRFPTLVPGDYQMHASLPNGPTWRLVPYPAGLGLSLTF